MEYIGPKVTGNIEEIHLSGPTLAIPDPSKRLYSKTDLSKNVMGAVLLQSGVSKKARKSEAQEKSGRKCEFEKSLERICLQPISFISISTLLRL